MVYSHPETAISMIFMPEMLIFCAWYFLNAGVLDDCPALPESYRDKANKLRAKYLPLEFSNNISIDEKYNLMVEW